MSLHYLTFLLAALVLIPAASALVITDVQVDSLTPGSEAQLVITVTNDADIDIEDVSLALDLSNLPFIAVGTSEDSFEELDEDDSDDFVFTLRASGEAEPGDYSIPYTLTHKDATFVKRGTVGVTINAAAQLDFSTTIENPVVGERGIITLKVINLGQGDARFASLAIVPEGFTLLSEETLYIGTINSDDFETVELEGIFTRSQPTVLGVLTYRDVQNQQHTQNIALPLTVYSKERAVQLGIIKKSSAPLYIGILVILIILWIVYRVIRKRRRLKKSMQSSRIGA